MGHHGIQPYLFFGGRCDEAIAFYGKAVGAQLDFLIRFSESPEPMPPGMLPPGFEHKVMHSSWRIGGQVVMASDGCGEPTKFDGFALSITLPTAAEATRAVEALADGGEVTMPLAPTFWAPLYGMLKDRFGVQWMISVEHKPEPAHTGGCC